MCVDPPDISENLKEGISQDIVNDDLLSFTDEFKHLGSGAENNTVNGHSKNKVNNWSNLNANVIENEISESHDNIFEFKNQNMPVSMTSFNGFGQQQGHNNSSECLDDKLFSVSGDESADSDDIDLKAVSRRKAKRSIPFRKTNDDSLNKNSAQKVITYNSISGGG